MLGTVVGVIPELDVTEGDVADAGDECVVRHGGICERLVADLRARIERGCNSGRERVEFNPDHLRVCWRVTDECARSTAGFEDETALETRTMEEIPGLGHHSRVGVVGVQDGVSSAVPLCRAQKRFELSSFVGEIGASWIEDLRHRAPTRPPGESVLLVRCRVAVLLLEHAQGLDRCDIGLGPGLLTRRHDDV